MRGRTRILPTALGGIALIAAAAVMLAMVPWEGCFASGDDDTAAAANTANDVGELQRRPLATDEDAAETSPVVSTEVPRASGDGTRLTVGWFGPRGLLPRHLVITVRDEEGRRYAPTRRHRRLIELPEGGPHPGFAERRRLHAADDDRGTYPPIYLTEFDGLPPGAWTPEFRLRGFPGHLLRSLPAISVPGGARVAAERPANLREHLKTLPLHLTGAGGLVLEQPCVHVCSAAPSSAAIVTGDGLIFPRDLPVDLVVGAEGHRPAELRDVEDEVRVTLAPAIRVTLVPDPPLPEPSAQHPGLAWTLHVGPPGANPPGPRAAAVLRDPVFPAMRPLARGRADWRGWLYAEDRFRAPGGRGWRMDVPWPRRYRVTWIGACAAHGRHVAESEIEVAEADDGRELVAPLPQEWHEPWQAGDDSTGRAAQASRD